MGRPQCNLFPCTMCDNIHVPPPQYQQQRQQPCTKYKYHHHQQPCGSRRSFWSLILNECSRVRNDLQKGSNAQPNKDQITSWTAVPTTAERHVRWCASRVDLTSVCKQLSFKYTVRTITRTCTCTEGGDKAGPIRRSWETK